MTDADTRHRPDDDSTCPDMPDAAALERRFGRHAAEGSVRLMPDDGLHVRRPLDALVRNISRGGVGLLVPAPLEEGSGWNLEFIANGLVSAVKPGVCRFCRPLRAGAWLAGVEFAAEPALLLALGVGMDAIRGDRPERIGGSLPGEIVDAA